MTATSSSRPRGEPRVALSLSRERLRVLTAGVAIGLGCTAIAAAAIGAGWYVAVSGGQQSEARTEIAMRPAEAIAEHIPDKNTPASPVTERFPSPDAALAAATPAAEPKVTPKQRLAFGMLPGAPSTSFDDAIRTGATGKPPVPPKLAALALSSPNAAAEAIPLPPRAPRVQLASLTPPDLKIAPQEEPRADRTAYYDITAKALYMPNGEKLEAHSGFGSLMDNPRHVHVKMRGATPPNTYRLTMREKLFHGVEAVRMNPENEGAMFNRAGILVHHYLLGPNGQSNGCISLKEYGKFLSAFKRGDVDRIVVVARLDQPPAAYVARKGTLAAWLENIF